MKKLIYFIFIVIWTPAFGQDNYYSGKIIYEYKFLDLETGENITEKMSPKMGKEQHYFINAENYKAYDENGRLKQLYNGKNNSYYFKNPNTGELMVMNARNQLSKVTEIKHSEATKEILGRTCRKVTIRQGEQETIYWYSSDIQVDPKKFSGHNFGGWATYLKESNGSLPLQFTVKNQNYTWVSTAVEINEMDLTEEEFDLAKISRQN